MLLPTDTPFNSFKYNIGYEPRENYTAKVIIDQRLYSQ